MPVSALAWAWTTVHGGDSLLDGDLIVLRVPQFVVAAVDGQEETIAIFTRDQVERRLRFG